MAKPISLVRLAFYALEAMFNAGIDQNDEIASGWFPEI
jgi:hypothetical protein